MTTRSILGLLLILVFTPLILSFGPFDKKPEKIIWGVTFSSQYARRLGINWRETYLATLDDLRVRYVRLPAYWNEIEGLQGQFRFDDLDWQINEAEKRDVKIILAIGRRLPRWPECHIPPWAKELSEKDQQERVLTMLEKVVNRYKDRSPILYWQVENEPFFPHFGICPEPDDKFFKKEIQLVRSLDPTRPIVVSDSGELSTWWKATRYPDILGTTMYRVVPHLDKTCCAKYIFPSWFYRKKANVISKFHPFDKLIVVELQAEAWTIKFITDTSIEEQYQSVNLEQFRENIQYARDSRIPEIYLWGVEWWRWLALQGHPEIWDEAEKLFP